MLRESCNSIPFAATAARILPSGLFHSTVNKSGEVKFEKKSGTLLLAFKSVIESVPLPADLPSVSLSYISPPPPDSSCYVSDVPIPVPDPRLEAQYRPRTRLKSEIKYGKLRRIQADPIICSNSHSYFISSLAFVFSINQESS
jgi:hypothetical protein